MPSFRTWESIAAPCSPGNARARMRIRDVRGFHANRDERDSRTPPDPSLSLSHQLSELHATRDLLAIFVPLHYAEFLHQGGLMTNRAYEAGKNISPGTG